MISVLIYCHDKMHIEEIHNLCSYNIALMGNEQLSVLRYSRDDSPSEASSQENVTIDLIFYEILSEADLEELRELRLLYEEAEVLIIAPSWIPTEWYLVPDIRPVMFLPEACDNITKKERIHDFFVYFYEKRMMLQSTDMLIIDVKEEKRFLNYDQIICLEASEKKIKVYYNQEQIFFYSSLKALERKLPSNFIRCHRSYIVNSIYISRMNLAQSNLIVKDKLVIPISKKFRNKMIHRLKKGNFNRYADESQS